MHAAIQVALGIVVTLLVYWMSLWILRRDQLVPNPSALRPQRQEMTVIDGYVDAGLIADTAWSTVNVNAQNYVHLDRSYNRRGGAQFTYSMWILLKSSAKNTVAGKTLFMRGNPKVFKTKNKSTNTQEKGVLIKCPRVRFGDTFDELVVEFNTLQDPYGGEVRIRPDPEPMPPAVDTAAGAGGVAFDSTMRLNALKLIQDRWAMLTFTFEDGVSISEFENGVLARFYLNDALYHTESVPGALRQNVGDLLAFPKIEDDKNQNKVTNVTVGDLRYFNYALGLEQVRHLFRRGPPKKPATLGVGPVGEPLYLSEYNKLDVYNS